MKSFEEFKKEFENAIGEPEYCVLFDFTEEEYMIIKYQSYVSFQRCSGGIKGMSGEIKYADIDELYESDLIDGINLKRDWNKIKDLYLN